MRKISKTVCVFLLLVSLCFCLNLGSGCKKDAKRSCYDIEVTLQGNVLSGKQTFTFYNEFESAISVLKFNLFPNAFRKDAKVSPILSQHYATSYPNGISYGEMQITTCKQQGKTLQFAIGGEDCNVLEVNLLEEVFPDESATVEIEFSVTFAFVVARTGVNDKTINLGNFYPILCGYDKDGFYECLNYGIGDPFYSDCADYTVKFTCDSGYVVASSGREVSNTKNGDLTSHVFSIENARSFCMVASKEFKTVSKKVNGVEIKYYYYQDQSPEESLKYAEQSIALFTQKFGAYPYPTYSVVQTKFVQGGMEFPALVMISDALEPKAYGEVIVHETAHQWWQTTVGNNEVEYGFLDEGLAEYSVVIFYENYAEYGLKRAQLIKSSEQTYKLFCSVSDKLFGKVDTSMMRSLAEFKSEYEYVNIAYVKPCIMYDVLRKTVGEQRFFKALKKYYADYAFKNATPYDLVGEFERVGANTNGFFESFFNGKAVI